jgi:hypothetical protein
MTSLSRDWHVQDAESTPSQAASEDDHRDQQEALPDEKRRGVGASVRHDDHREEGHAEHGGDGPSPSLERRFVTAERISATATSQARTVASKKGLHRPVQER